MINQITCDTSIGSILSEDDISSIVSSVEEEVASYINSVQDMIHQEETYDLSSRGFHVENTPLLANRAGQFLSSITLHDALDSWKEEMYSALSLQRSKELKQLYNKVKEKINDLLLSYNHYISAYNSCTDAGQKSTYSSYINSLSSSIKSYKNKLKTVEELM